MDKKQLTKSLKNGGFSSRIVKAFEKVPREEFIPKDLEEYAYEDIALPLKEGATISQPYTIAFMLDLLELNKVNKKSKILEIGSGCGYVLALLYETTKGNIFGIELSKELVLMSEKILRKLKYIESSDNYSINSQNPLMDNSEKRISNNRIIHNKIKIMCRNGYFGLKEEAPFGRILISAASNEIPEHLYEQIKEGGIIVVPVRNSIFKIRRLKKDYEIKEFPGFAFVPLIKD